MRSIIIAIEALTANNAPNAIHMTVPDGGRPPIWDPAIVTAVESNPTRTHRAGSNRSASKYPMKA